MITKPLYLELAALVDARLRCLERGNEYASKHKEKILALVKEHMPSGSGVDCGTEIDLDASHGEKLVFTLSYHHMDDAGGYDGWTEHRVTVTPAFVCGPNIKISGRDRNQIKDYLCEIVSHALNTAEY